MPFLMSFLTSAIAYIRSALPWIAGMFGASVSNVLVSAGFGVVAFSGFNYLTGHLVSIGGPAGKSVEFSHF